MFDERQKGEDGVMMMGRSIFDPSLRPSYTSISHVSSRHGGSDQVITGRLILIYFDLN